MVLLDQTAMGGADRLWVGAGRKIKYFPSFFGRHAAVRPPQIVQTGAPEGAMIAVPARVRPAGTGLRSTVKCCHRFAPVATSSATAAHTVPGPPRMR